ncbi:MAG TPA: EAL domain-containing protein, partial [Acidimicrobiales bacterium]|nr:EAL domain-containing protein [Acidimicrobiales bacterium]
TGLAEGELEVFYQPVIDLATGAAVAAEALVRWHHPDRGLLLPGDFIPLAEETGVVVELGRWVLNQACVTAAGWPGGPKVAVNLSARQLSDSALVDDVAAALIASGLAPDRLVVEVTETSVMSDPERARIALCALKELGVTIAIDDFGTGYSSLAYLNLLPVDEVKLDGCFASALASGEGSPALVQAIVAMAAALNVALVVEGVETDDQRRQLAALGCQLAQGFLWSEPVPAGSLRLAQPVLA